MSRVLDKRPVVSTASDLELVRERERDAMRRQLAELGFPHVLASVAQAVAVTVGGDDRVMELAAGRAEREILGVMVKVAKGYGWAGVT